MRWELLPHKSVKRLLIPLELQSSCHVTVHCSVPNTAHCISGEKTATPPPFYLPSLTANDPVVKKQQQKESSNLQYHWHFAAVSNLQKCCCLMELLLVALSGCSLLFPGPFSRENPSVFLGEFKLSSLSIKLAAFFLITLSFTQRSPGSLTLTISHSALTRCSSHAPLWTRTRVGMMDFAQ